MRKSVFLAAPLTAFCCAAALAQAPQKATASFINQEGKTIGRAELVQTPHGVLISAELRDIAPDEHAFHIHAKGQCDPASKFNSAGPHFAAQGQKHGYEEKDGPHSGDMPNQFAAADGALRFNVLNPAVTLGGGKGSLFGPEGAALVLHAKRDDYKSQPAGDAGDRVACAVIKAE